MSHLKILREMFLGEETGGIVGYHGSNHRIDQPDPMSEKGLWKAMDFGPGMYFTTSQEDAKQFGSAVYQANLAIKKPLRIESEPTAEMLRVQKAFRIDDEFLEFADEGWWQGLIGLINALIETGQYSKGKFITFLSQKLGYDAIIIPQEIVRQSKAGAGSNGDYIVVFSKETIQGWQLVSGKGF